jgi:hypothetical protein
MSVELTGPALAATHVPQLSTLVAHHEVTIPPSPIIPTEPCAPVLDQLFHVDFLGVAPPDFTF